MKKMKFIVLTPLLSKWLITARESVQMQQSKAAEEMKLSQTFLSGLERGASKLVQIDKWNKLYGFYVAKGAAVLPADKDPIQTLPDPVAIRKEVQEMKDATKAPFKDIAESLGIGASSLTNFMKGQNLKAQQIYALRDGLVRLKAKPAELVKEKVLEEKQAQKPRKYKKKSLIENAPSAQGLPSLAELDVMELQLIHRMRARHEQASAKPKHLNGHRH